VRAELQAMRNSAMIGNSAAKTYIEKADALATQLTEVRAANAALREVVELAANVCCDELCSPVRKAAQRVLASSAPSQQIGADGRTHENDASTRAGEEQHPAGLDPHAPPQ
jgi:hypothetical protein